MSIPVATEKEVTRLLRLWQHGNVSARDQVFHWLDGHLRKRARAMLRQERPSHTLQATALVNEAYLRLAGAEDLGLRDRSHFFAIASKVMRRILVEHARKRLAAKRGADPKQITLLDGLAPASQPAGDEEILAVHEALAGLAKIYPRQEQVLEMRFFVGMRIREIAEALSISVATVKTDLQLGKAWLNRELGGR